MFGFIFGGICLVALAASVRRRRAFAYGYPGFGLHRGFGGYRRHGAFRCQPGAALGRVSFGKRGLRAGLRGLFMRLDTTPGQEKAILRAVDTLLGRAQETRASLDRTRRDVAAVFAGDVLDPDAFQQVMARQGEELHGLSDVACAALAEVHEALEPEQRRELAELLAAPHRYRG